MSKPVKEMIMRMYREKFAGVNDALLVDIRGVDAHQNKALRSNLAAKQIRITVVKNHLARKVFSDTALAPLNDLIEGPTALVYGGESVVNVAREIIEQIKKIEKLQVKGAVMEGTVFGAAEVERLSKFPTRHEAQAQVIQLLLSPAGNVIGAATSAGANIAGILKTMVEKLEKGEEIKQVA
ncbi:MAG TPA: 50S ribosomal protein L10 [Fimbriimonadaceae bacterium]|nr:50S ribosomal protein L10 [Fimbriimonadaceae bacterium]